MERIAPTEGPMMAIGAFSLWTEKRRRRKEEGRKRNCSRMMHQSAGWGWHVQCRIDCVRGGCEEAPGIALQAGQPFCERVVTPLGHHTGRVFHPCSKRRVPGFYHIQEPCRPPPLCSAIACGLRQYTPCLSVLLCIYTCCYICTCFAMYI